MAQPVIPEKLVELIRQHELAEYSWGVDGCQCGHDDTESHATHVAEVLTAEGFGFRGSG